MPVFGFRIHTPQPNGWDGAFAPLLALLVLVCLACTVGLNFKPKSWALQRWVRTRHQSTLNCRPMATAICLRLLRVALGSANTFRHLATAL